MASRDDIAIAVRDLTVRFGSVKAVDGVSFEVRRGETFALVGESGSGKTTTARALAGLVKPSGGDFSLSGRIGMVFQDPLGSLNPRRTVREIVRSRVDLLEETGLGRDALDRYPHEFSGGERQRICIARALATEPSILICDEAVSALDLSVRSQVLDLLAQTKRRHSLTMLFITHDLGVVQHVADRIAVMREGRIVEQGAADEVLRHPKAEYTKILVASVPRIGAGPL